MTFNNYKNFVDWDKITMSHSPWDKYKVTSSALDAINSITYDTASAVDTYSVSVVDVYKEEIDNLKKEIRDLQNRVDANEINLNKIVAENKHLREVNKILSESVEL